MHISDPRRLHSVPSSEKHFWPWLDTHHLCNAQENLAQERKLFAEGNTVMLQTILSPVQAGALMLEAWPAHCDCFAFAAAALNEVQCLPNQL